MLTPANEIARTRFQAEELYGMLQKCEHALDSVSSKLDAEFDTRYANTGLNPLVLSKRIKQLSTHIPALKADCQALIQNKQSLIDAAKQSLLSNRAQLLDMSGRLGVAQDAGDDAEMLSDFGDALAEWDKQAATQGREVAGPPSYMSREELNRALAGSMLLNMT
ncbi:hypothetical protein FOA52_008482 [Chlamydomonas sp. UWO 241]|nr:hypothetical protein FOA52_008482 [Chlamydomonas sp. UWO 241]